jgi:hypothetical protein
MITKLNNRPKNIKKLLQKLWQMFVAMASTRKYVHSIWTRLDSYINKPFIITRRLRVKPCEESDVITSNKINIKVKM